MTVAECPICHSMDEPTKEHVWARWFLKRRDRAGAPLMGWAANGAPVLDRHDQQIHGTQRQRVFLDVCERCNNEMDRQIEKPAKAPMSVLALNGWRGSLTTEEWRAVGLWWAKVLLLTGLQGSALEHPALQKAVHLTFDDPMPDVRWLSRGSGIPDHVSVFIHNADMSLTGTEHDLVIPAQVHFEDKPKAHTATSCPWRLQVCVSPSSRTWVSRSATPWSRQVTRGSSCMLRRSKVTSATWSL